MPYNSREMREYAAQYGINIITTSVDGQTRTEPRVKILKLQKALVVTRTTIH